METPDGPSETFASEDTPGSGLGAHPVPPRVWKMQDLATPIGAGQRRLVTPSSGSTRFSGCGLALGAAWRGCSLALANRRAISPTIG